VNAAAYFIPAILVLMAALGGAIALKLHRPLIIGYALSWGTVRITMNQETGQQRSQSGWRHLVEQLVAYTANLPSSLIGMEAGVGSHFLGRALCAQGHEVRLIPAQFVRPFVKSNKNDYRDGEAIAEAVERENMRFVPSKTEDQLDLQALHRVRDRLVARRTSVINQIRAFLLERGISFRKGPASLRRQMPEILENADETLSTRMRSLLDFLWQEWKGLQLQIETLDADVEKIASSDATCVRLQQIPGVGPLVSTAAYLPLETGRLSGRDGSLPPGWGSYPDNGQPGAKLNCWVSVRGETHICARCSSTERGPQSYVSNAKAPVWGPG
jgi:transposase